MVVRKGQNHRSDTHSVDHDFEEAILQSGRMPHLKRKPARLEHAPGSETPARKHAFHSRPYHRQTVPAKVTQTDSQQSRVVPFRNPGRTRESLHHKSWRRRNRGKSFIISQCEKG